MNTFSFFRGQTVGPRVERVWHDVRLRSVKVIDVEHVTPAMVRVTFAGDELHDFRSLAPDDHLKIFVATPSGEIAKRDYTPRRHDSLAGTLVIDFAIHEASPAARWALGAQPGQTIQIGGPKSSTVIAPIVERWLLIGDESALPSIGRRIEEARAGIHITGIVAVANRAEEQRFDTWATLDMHWVHRPLCKATSVDALLLAAWPLRVEPDTYLWIAGEASMVRAMRTHFVKHCAHPNG
ncbi:siderophore-interacting protein [Burkholderia sp. BCC0419]|uniref:siderophore-interacting protein n=1 Tax=Burkholderia sp. BCC0419 TaxID=486878 RepID=UPI001ABA6EFB|nr:siderophore-interacting protein [Burkholderia sp. BCC0419]